MESTYSNKPDHFYRVALPDSMHGSRCWYCSTADDMVRNHSEDGCCGDLQLTPEAMAWLKGVPAGESTLTHLIPPELARKLGI